MATKSYIDVVVSDSDNILDIEAGTYNGNPLFEDISGLATSAELTNYSTTADLSNHISDFGALRTAVGIAEGVSSYGTFTGDILSPGSSSVSLFQELETELVATRINADNSILLSGLPEGDTDLGTFSGTTLSDNSTIKTVLQELELAVESVPSNASITALENDRDNLQALSGMPDEAVDLGTFTGSVVSDSSTIKAAIQELETFTENGISDNSSDVTEIRSSLGVVDGAVDMGVFTGSIITDNVTAKVALQELETELQSFEQSGIGRWVYATLDAASTSDAALVSLNAGDHVMEVRVNVTTGFDSFGAVSIGWTVDDDAIVPTGDVDVLGVENISRNLFYTLAGTQDVRAYLQGGMTSGVCDVAIFVVTV